MKVNKNIGARNKVFFVDILPDIQSCNVYFGLNKLGELENLNISALSHDV